MSADLIATCRCGQLTVRVSGDPLRVSICHCHECQRRSGSAFAWQGRWPEALVTITGQFRGWTAEREGSKSATFNFCGECGGTVFYTNEGLPGQIAVAIGAMAGQPQPAPWVSVYENRLQDWLAITGEPMEHM